MNRLPASHCYQRQSVRWKRYEKQRPGHQLQVDVKFIEPVGQKGLRAHYQFTAIDDCTRLRVLRAYPRWLHGIASRRAASAHIPLRTDRVVKPAMVRRDEEVGGNFIAGVERCQMTEHHSFSIGEASFDAVRTVTKGTGGVQMSDR